MTFVKKKLLLIHFQVTFETFPHIYDLSTPKRNDGVSKELKNMSKIQNQVTIKGLNSRLFMDLGTLKCHTFTCPLSKIAANLFPSLLNSIDNA